ncbi:MAG: hypothetical protein ABII27_08775 [bacterium]
MAKSKKKAADQKSKTVPPKKTISESFKKFVPKHIIPESVDKEVVNKFIHNMYERGAKMFSIGAKKVGEASSKVARNTKLYYDFNQLKLKMHLAHTKIGEFVEQQAVEGNTSVNLTSGGIKDLLIELEAFKEQQEQIKKELKAK